MVKTAVAHLKYFLQFNDAVGAISAAIEIGTETKALLGPEELLSAGVVELLIMLLQNPRADAQAAAASAAAAACRFEEVQVEWVALQGAAPLTAVLANGHPEAQLEACRAAAAIAMHRDGREALAQAGAVRALLRIARDVLHPAQEHAAAALATAVGLEGATPRLPSVGSTRKQPIRASRRAAASSSAASASASATAAAIAAAGSSGTQPQPPHGSRAAAAAAAAAEGVDAVAAAGSEAIDSFVLMAQRGGGISREQAAYGLRHLCRSADSRVKLVDAGAVEALLCCADHFRVEVPRAAAAALAALTEEPAAATRLPAASLPPSQLPAGVNPADFVNSSGVAIIHSLSAVADGATRLAALNVYANLCAQPSNAALLMRAGTMRLLVQLLVDDAPAECQQAAVKGIAHLNAHAPISAEIVERHGLLDELTGCARGKRRLGRRAALELKAHALHALAQLASRAHLHDCLVDGGLPTSLLEIATVTPHAPAQRSLLLALLRILHLPHSTSRLQLMHTPSAIATLRSVVRTKNFDDDVRHSAAVALCFVAADAQCHLPAGQPPRNTWAALAQNDAQRAASAVAGGAGGTTTTSATVGLSSVPVAPAAAPGRPPLKDANGMPPRPSAAATSSSSASSHLSADTVGGAGGDVPPSDSDFFPGVVAALAEDSLRILALQALASLGNNRRRGGGLKLTDSPRRGGSRSTPCSKEPCSKELCSKELPSLATPFARCSLRSLLPSLAAPCALYSLRSPLPAPSAPCARCSD